MTCLEFCVDIVIRIFQNVQEKSCKLLGFFKKCSGDYVYIGISKGLKRTFDSNPSSCNFENQTIPLIVNVDGIPLHVRLYIEN